MIWVLYSNIWKASKFRLRGSGCNAWPSSSAPAPAAAGATSPREAAVPAGVWARPAPGAPPPRGGRRRARGTRPSLGVAAQGPWMLVVWMVFLGEFWDVLGMWNRLDLVCVHFFSMFFFSQWLVVCIVLSSFGMSPRTYSWVLRHKYLPWLRQSRGCLFWEYSCQL